LLISNTKFEVLSNNIGIIHTDLHKNYLVVRPNFTKMVS